MSGSCGPDRHHYLASVSPFLAFAVLYFVPWNPIYPGIAAMFIGAGATVWCRPDLKGVTWIGGLLFLVYYVAFLQGLELLAPGYIERVWRLDLLLGVYVVGMPLEELLFATGFGTYWSGVYAHPTFRLQRPSTTLVTDHRPRTPRLASSPMTIGFSGPDHGSIIPVFMGRRVDSGSTRTNLCGRCGRPGHTGLGVAGHKYLDDSLIFK